MARITLSSGSISDVAKRARKGNWSDLRQRIAALEPGDVVNVDCSVEEIPRMLSTILTIGKRLRGDGEWVVTTRTEGRRINVFLAPRG